LYKLDCYDLTHWNTGDFYHRPWVKAFSTDEVSIQGITTVTLNIYLSQTTKEIQKRGTTEEKKTPHAHS
jgi:hypothetical protein